MFIENYPRLSKRQPFISVALSGVNLNSYSPIGDGLTKLVISRIGKLYEETNINVLEQVGNNFTFAASPELLDSLEGRYQYKLYYKGNYIGTKQFILEKPAVEIKSV